MSKREDIIEPEMAGRARRGLVYSEILGWIDLGHAQGRDIINLLEEMRRGEISTDPYYDLVYAQSMNMSGFCVGNSIRWKVKKGRSLHERHSIALAMMMQISLQFEGLQVSAPYNWFTDSGFSAEDLVSNLLGFYRVVRPMNYFPHLKLISKAKALERWDYYGAVGVYKNKLFRPLLFPEPTVNKVVTPSYGTLPSFMTAIQPFNNFNKGVVEIVRPSSRHDGLAFMYGSKYACR